MICVHAQQRRKRKENIYQKIYKKVLSATVIPKDIEIFCSINS